MFALDPVLCRSLRNKVLMERIGREVNPTRPGDGVRLRVYEHLPKLGKIGPRTEHPISDESREVNDALQPIGKANPNLVVLKRPDIYNMMHLSHLPQRLDLVQRFMRHSLIPHLSQFPLVRGCPFSD